jgi:hypothetical protein
VGARGTLLEIGQHPLAMLDLDWRQLTAEGTRTGNVGELPGARLLAKRPEALEAENVIPIRADAPLVTELCAAFAAAGAQITVGAAAAESESPHREYLRP